MTGAEKIIQVLADEGVDTIFGYSGGAILPTYDAIFRFNEGKPQKQQIRLVVPANEQGAGFMAAGYARASGRVGVFLVTSGPGATNCVTPIRDCMADSVPVVLICGQVPRAAIGSDAFQEAPVFNIMSACAKHVFLCSKEDELEETIRTAFEIARSGRPGPVVIDVPKDVQLATGPYKGDGLIHFRGFEERMSQLQQNRLSKESIAAFFKQLGDSERPLIYAGGGVINSNAAGALRAFSKAFGIPVVTTLMGIGSVDTTEELSLHMLGMHGTAYANYAVEDCDMLIAVGSRFDDRVAGKISAFAPKARYVAHIDIDAAEIGKVKEVTWAHAGDASATLNDLVEGGKKFKPNFGAWHKHVMSMKRDHALNYNKEAGLIQPQHVIEVLNEITKGEAIVATGVGQHQMWAAQYFDFHSPRSWITSGSMGTMGFGLPASIGAQIACPDRTVIDIDGDGSLRMNLGELETATTYDVPVKVLLLNNLGDGMVRQWQRTYYGHRFSGSDKSLHKKDFVMADKADVFSYAELLSDKAKIRETLEAFVKHKGPAFLEVMIDHEAHVYPMVGPGMGYKEMETGPFITPRKPEIVAVKKPADDSVDITQVPELF
ncbi:MAG: biosynthetic-type acetolactate synthase large subunit [Candidatus Hydrogenedentes bacterium]|nr:biosynthetic-type acetolactate synthase large subunit [Candidatus Hydrogenedentota bacterium]